MMNSHSGKKVATVVVTRNRKELLLQCIEALKKQTYPSMSVYIIDNDSSDGTKDAIQEYIDSGIIHYTNTGSNRGEPEGLITA